MHPLLFILAVAVTHGLVASHSPSIKRTSNTGAVRDFLEKLLPTSKNALLHELMGPKVGADVSQSSSILRMRVKVSFLVSLASLFP